MDIDEECFLEDVLYPWLNDCPDEYDEYESDNHGYSDDFED